LTNLIGVTMAKSQRFATMQEASVDSKLFNKYDAKIKEGLQRKMPLMWKILLKGAEYVGIDLNEVMDAGELDEFIRAAQENRLDVLLQGENLPSASSKNWKLR